MHAGQQRCISSTKSSNRCPVLVFFVTQIFVRIPRLNRRSDFDAV